MEKTFYIGNRRKLYDMLQPQSLLVLFAGTQIRKSADAYYPFYADRNFVYLTGIEQHQSILLAQKDIDGTVKESLYLLPKDPMAERWTGKRLSSLEAEELSGISNVRNLEAFNTDFHNLIMGGKYLRLYLDLFRQEIEDADRQGHAFARMVQEKYPCVTPNSMNPYVRKLRTIKQPCEIEALRRAEEITKAGILAMMRASKPGMYEYQYHEEWGIGFRLEDNCLVTEDGCENLSAGIPRTVEEIEAVMCK